MSDIVSPLLQWLNANPEWAGFVTFAISAAESVAVVGTIVPGSITMTAIGTLAGAGVIPLWATIIWAIAGAIVGDGISYWLGHYFQHRIVKIWPFRDNPGLLQRGEAFVHKYGVMSVFIGRFVGPVRALIPLVAGMLGMKPLHFIIANVTSAILWAPVYMLPGILLGAASLELPPDIAVHVILVLFLIGLFIILCLWFIYKLLQLIHTQLNQLQNNIWQSLKKSRLSPLTQFLKHHDTEHAHGQLTLAFYFLMICLLSLALIFYVKHVGANSIVVNEALFHLFRGMRHASLDTVMLNITLLGQKEVILPVILVVCAYLFFKKRSRAAFHVLGLGILAAGGIFVLKNVIKSARPWGILNSPETFSMPSGHAILAMTIFVGLAYFIASPLKSRLSRLAIYTGAFILMLAISISRLYLGAHWFTDVVASWLISAAILLLVIMSYQRHKEKPISPASIILLTFTTLLVTFSLFHYKNVTLFKLNYQQLDWPSKTIAMDDWWQQREPHQLLPAYRASLFGFPSQRINIEWSGDLAQIKAALIQAGWTKPPARDLISTLHRIADVKSTQYLSMASPQYLDKKPTLILAKPYQDKGLLVIRLWSANRTIKDNNTTLWVGIIGIVPHTYSWIFKKHPGDLTIDTPLVLSNDATVLNNWEGKVVCVIHRSHKNKLILQKIILLRPAQASVNKK